MIPDEVLRPALEAVTGEPAVLVKDLDWRRKNPCHDCPFLKTSPYHEGVADSLPQYFQSIQDGTFGHTCHKTDNRSGCDGPRNWNGPTQACVGALYMLLKTGRGMDIQLPLLQAADAGKLDLRDMTRRAKANSKVFNVLQLLEFYERETRKRLPRAEVQS